MSAKELDELAAVDISTLSEEKLREVAKDLQQFYIHRTEEASKKQGKFRSNMRQERKPYGIKDSTSIWASASHSNWILSENEYPEQESSVIYFDGNRIDVRTTKDLNNSPAIISKLPSRWARQVYVYTDSFQSAEINVRFRITSGMNHNNDLRWLKTIHLEKLPAEVRFKVFVGSIKWLFIADNNSRSSTESSME